MGTQWLWLRVNPSGMYGKNQFPPSVPECLSNWFPPALLRLFTAMFVAVPTTRAADGDDEKEMNDGALIN